MTRVAVHDTSVAVHDTCVAVHDTSVAVHDTSVAVHDTCVAVHDTCAKGKSEFKNMLGNNILKLLRPVLEDKVEKFKWKLLVVIVDINLVVREHMKLEKTL